MEIVLKVNPKDLAGMKKVDLSLVPPIATAHEALAFTDGALKYLPFNWRENPVRARVYIAACMRHLMLWAEGQEETDDTGVHNLGAARACLGILLDAKVNGNLIDDRGVRGGSQIAYEKEMKKLEAWVRRRVEQAEPRRAGNGRTRRAKARGRKGDGRCGKRDAILAARNVRQR